jgi:hypothetical protein
LWQSLACIGRAYIAMIENIVGDCFVCLSDTHIFDFIFVFKSSFLIKPIVFLFLFYFRSSVRDRTRVILIFTALSL